MPHAWYAADGSGRDSYVVLDQSQRGAVNKPRSRLDTRRRKRYGAEFAPKPSGAPRPKPRDGIATVSTRPRRFLKRQNPGACDWQRDGLSSRDPLLPEVLTPRVPLLGRTKSDVTNTSDPSAIAPVDSRMKVLKKETRRMQKRFPDQPHLPDVFQTTYSMQTTGQKVGNYT